MSHKKGSGKKRLIPNPKTDRRPPVGETRNTKDRYTEETKQRKNVLADKLIDEDEHLMNVSPVEFDELVMGI